MHLKSSLCILKKILHDEKSFNALVMPQKSLSWQIVVNDRAVCRVGNDFACVALNLRRCLVRVVSPYDACQ